MDKIQIRNSTRIFLLFLLPVVLLGINFCNQPVNTIYQNKKFKLSNAQLGGGGYITGLIQHPREKDVVYVRCDVAGIFKSEDGGKTWSPKNSGMMKSHHHSVESFALSHQRPNVLFRCSGEARNGKIFGDIHKSIDGGKTWVHVTDLVNYYGNGPTRANGEKIAVDPYNPDCVVTVGYTSGVWSSEDEGLTWNYRGLANVPMGCLGINPYYPNRYYIGTLSQMPQEDYLYPNGNSQLTGSGYLYFSDDNGLTWKKLFEKENANITNIAFDPSNSDIIFITIEKDGIYKSEDGGTVFKKLTKGLPEGNYTCADIDISPLQPHLIYAALLRLPGNDKVPEYPVYISSDGGNSWHLPKGEYDWDSDFKGYSDHYERVEQMGWSISKLRADRFVEGKLYLCNWFGVSISDDYGKTWDGHFFKGIENVCLEYITADPLNKDKVYFVGADGQPSYSLDGGKTYSFFKYLDHPNTYYCSTAIAVSKYRNGTVVYGITNNNERLSAIARSDDGGENCEFAIHLPQGLYVQALREDTFFPGRFYAYIDGELKNGAGLMVSHDWGKSWEKIDLKLPSYIRSLPHERFFIENELLSVVQYQTKNACGSNQLLAIDPHQPNTLFFGEPTEGVFVSTDGGQNWKNTAGFLPFQKTRASVLNILVCDSDNEGVIYAGFISEGLWRSTDNGINWEKIYPLDDKKFNASSVAISGKNGEELYVVCEPLYWSDCPSAIMYSGDKGLTWTNLYNPELGAIRWKGISVSKETGNVYAISCGNGAFWGIWE